MKKTKLKAFLVKDGKSMLILAGICLIMVGIPLFLVIENNHNNKINSEKTISENATAFSETVSSDSVSENSTIKLTYDDLLASGGMLSVGALSNEEVGEIIVLEDFASALSETNEASSELLALGNSLSENTVSDNSLLVASLSDNSISENSVSENSAQDDLGYEYSDLAISNVSDYVNVRENPTVDSDVVGKIYNGAVAHVLGRAGVDLEWFFIESGNVTGFIKAEYFISGDEAAEVAENYVKKYATVLCNTLNVRERSSLDSNKIGFAENGEKYEVLECLDGWYKIQYSNSQAGYVAADYVSLSEEFTYARTLEEDSIILAAEKARNARANESSVNENLTYVNVSTPPSQLYTSNAELRQAIIDYAMQYLGNRYVSGGSSLAGGTDCSGFTSLVYAQFGYSLARTTTGQCANNGRSVSYEEAQPGDIVCYAANGYSCSHVGFYIGNGQILHSSTPRRGVVIDSITACGKILAIKNVID